MLHGKHILKSFDKDLNHINEDLITMLKLIIEELHLVLEYLKNNQNTTIPEQIQEKELSINALNQDVLDASIKIFSLRSPVAWDLRFVFTSTHIAKRFERSGDNIKKAIKDITSLTSIDEEINQKIIVMLNANLESHKIMLNNFLEHTMSQTALHTENDDIIDQTFSSLCSTLLQKIQHNPDKLNLFYSYLFLGRRLEHIGDNVLSVKKLINFIETGKFND